MSPEGRRLRRIGVAAGVLLGAHVALMYALDALGLVESLLAPSGLRALAALPLAALFYLVRLALLFAMPGLLLVALLRWAAARIRHGRQGRG